MHLRFWKYHGTGNDFIVADNRHGRIALTTDQIRWLCDRHFGIGSDGLILIGASREMDFHMDFFNPDGSQSFCGNGSRCAVRYARTLGIGHGLDLRFSAIDGDHQAKVDGEEIQIRMKDVPEVSQISESDFFIHTGSPHYLRWESRVNELDVIREGRAVRYSDQYRQEGINVNFLVETGHGVFMRTYERGVEDETLSCGTGVTAAGLLFGWKHPEAERVNVRTRGGDLSVSWKRSGNGFYDIWLKGPAQPVFEGEVHVD